jgi:GTP-binding protein Era
MFHSGFVSILGRPNAGKSTLLNRLVGQKIAIVTDKPQTTRNRIQGVVNRPEAQVVFLDTPGLHKPDTTINRKMMADVREALKGCDLLLLMVDATRPFGAGDAHALEMVRGSHIPAFLLLNKIDALRSKEELLPLIEKQREQFDFREIFPVSAATGEGVGTLLEGIVAVLPEGPQYFPPDYVTDQPARFLASEIVREKIIVLTRQELPYASMVLVDSFEDKPNLLRIHATVFVERPGQKAILIGVRGEMMKKIGTQAREELEKRFGVKVFLQLFVKVRANWRENEHFLRAVDWRSMIGPESESEEGPVVVEP